MKCVRNVRSGLRARTLILELLESQPSDATRISEEAVLSYGVVIHHLRLLRSEGIVERRGVRPYSWVSSGLGQRRLS